MAESDLSFKNSSSDSIQFSMVGAREVIDKGAPHIIQQVNSLEQAVRNNDVGLTFDLAKTLMETTCKTILRDRGLAYSDTDDFPHLVKITVDHLPIIPKSHENIPGIKESIKTFIGGINALIKGLSEIRNKEGLASHGKDAYALQLDNYQAHLIARSVDALVNFLFKIHRGYPKGHAVRGIQYGDNPGLNDYIDSVNDICAVFDYRYKASEVLYKLDFEAYCVLLSEMEESEIEDNPNLSDLALFRQLPLTGEQE